MPELDALAGRIALWNRAVATQPLSVMNDMTAIRSSLQPLIFRVRLVRLAIGAETGAADFARHVPIGTNTGNAGEDIASTMVQDRWQEEIVIDLRRHRDNFLPPGDRRRVGTKDARSPRMNRPPTRDLRVLAAFGAITGAAALLGKTATGEPERSPWYRALEKPPFQPPSRVFGPVWGVLYATIAYTGYRVFTQGRGRGRRVALLAWGLQLGLNAAWSWLFFEKKNLRASFAEIVVLWLSIGAYARAASAVDRRAALLVLPYWAWVTFAAVLNGEILRRNSASA